MEASSNSRAVVGLRLQGLAGMKAQSGGMPGMKRPPDNVEHRTLSIERRTNNDEAGISFDVQRSTFDVRRSFDDLSTASRALPATACMLLLALLLSGCASARLQSARAYFYAGRFAEAETELAEEPKGNTDKVLWLMEKGTILQTEGKYEDSNTNMLRAAELEKKLMPKSVSEQSASLLVNDNTVSFRGTPFERTLIHTLLANNYLMLGKWEDAGVEARNIIEHLQNLEGYPDDAYSRYIAGFCLDLLGDPSNAALQYKNAAGLLQEAVIDSRTGTLGPTNAAPINPATRRNGVPELVCFVMVGRSPTGYQARSGMVYGGNAPFAEFYNGSEYMGRSYSLGNVAALVAATKQKQAALQAAKEVARLAVKETIAYQVKKKNDAMGNLVEMILLAMDAPDDRRWETLPMWLQVARFPCPDNLQSFRVVFKNPNGALLREKLVTEPIVRHGRTTVSFCRYMPIQLTTQTAK